MAVSIAPEALFESLAERILIDVRTPAEYAHGHIPGAVNLPLFSNEERVVVGTLYKQAGPSAALLKGLDFVGSKMSGFVRQAERLAPGRKVAVHCWRGGKRSGSMAWLLGFADFDVEVLTGGYQAYRRHILQAFNEQRFEITILGGHTGSGKTEVLHHLRNQGAHVLDLEAIARHKGSSFGALGELLQPTVEQFENDLFEACRRIPAGARVWIEDESRSIGRVYIPPGFWQQMNAARMVRLDVPMAVRVKKLVASYAGFSKADLAASFERIRKRLGGQHLKAALEALEQDDFDQAAEIALRYYDKAYEATQAKRDAGLIFPMDMPADAPDQTAKLLLERFPA